MPSGSRYLPKPGRPRSDREFHGLHRRFLYVHIHGRSGYENGRTVHDVSTRQVVWDLGFRIWDLDRKFKSIEIRAKRVCRFALFYWELVTFRWSGAKEFRTYPDYDRIVP